MKAPIIFFHYNDSKYLKYTLSLAKKNNPDKNIILIGDQSNRHYEKIGIKHFYFNNYLKGTEINNFNTSYKYTVGSNFENKTYGRPWTKFNFQKWYVLLAFLRSEEINNFWTFDSDVYIFSNLEPYEADFKNLDYTSWNYIHQLQGFANLKLIEKYCGFIIKTFSDQTYIKSQIKDFQKNPDYGLTLMRIFKKFKEDNNLRVLNIFDTPNSNNAGICCHYFVDNGFINDKKYEIYIDNSNLKKKQIYTDNKGSFFLKTINSTYTPISILDTSWLHFNVQTQLFNNSISPNIKISGYKKISYKTSIFQKAILKIKYFFN